MSAIAKLQHEDAVGAGRQLSFNSVFNELFMRDRIAALYELVGDLPNRLWYGTEETPGNYALKATEALELFITIPGKAGKLDVPAQLRELMSSMEKTQKVLDQNPSDSTAGREREDTVLRLAILAQELGKETRRLTRGSRDFNPSEAKAADAIVLSTILAEGIRGALGKSRAEDVRGPAGAHRIPKRLERSDVRESLKFGRKRLVEVREKAKKEEKDPVDPRHYRGVER